MHNLGLACSMGKTRRAALAALFYACMPAKYAWHGCSGDQNESSIATTPKLRRILRGHFLAAVQHKRRNSVLNEQVSKEDADRGEPATCRA